MIFILPGSSQIMITKEGSGIGKPILISDDVKEALEELGIGGMTVSEVLQTSEARHRGRSFGGTKSSVNVVPKIKIEVAVPTQQAERVVEAICLHGSAGKSEDGSIVIKRVEGIVRIRTGDSDDDALST